MLFLLNDVVLNLTPQGMTPPLQARRFSALGLADVTRLGREIFADEPLLQHRHLERARRLALLIISKAPEVNAALFVAQERGCTPASVAVRLASVDIGLLAGLQERQQTGGLSTVVADREVWRRLAA
jgi:hypothetical protein